MPQNKPLKGEVVKVELIHLGEGWPCTEVTLRISHPSQPYRPEGYVHSWRELQEQQETAFSQYELNRFARFEREKEEYALFTASLWSLHLGGVEIFQED